MLGMLGELLVQTQIPVREAVQALPRYILGHFSATLGRASMPRILNMRNTVGEFNFA